MREDVSPQRDKLVIHLLHRGHPLIAIFTHPLSVSITSMLKPMNTRKNSFSHSFSTSTSRFMKKGRLAHEKGRSLSNSSATSNCEPHDFIRLRASATVGLESREADGCPSFLEKRDRRELSFLIESRSQCAQTAPSRTSRA